MCRTPGTPPLTKQVAITHDLLEAAAGQPARPRRTSGVAHLARAYRMRSSAIGAGQHLRLDAVDARWYASRVAMPDGGAKMGNMRRFHRLAGVARVLVVTLTVVELVGCVSSSDLAPPVLANLGPTGRDATRGVARDARSSVDE